MAVAYGVKYRIEIGCIAGTVGATETYRLDIEKSGYSSSVTDLNSGANPITINWPGGAHWLAPLKPSEMIIEVEEASADDLTEFKTFEDQEYQVKLYNNTNQLRWTGWLTNDHGYIEDLSMPNPKTVVLRAIDGVGLLRKKEFRALPAGPTAALRTGRVSALLIIQQALESFWPDSTSGSFLTYGMLRNTQDGTTAWTNHTDPTDAKNPFSGQFWDQSYFMIDEVTPMSWFDVLRIILRNNFCMMTNGFHKHGWPSQIKGEFGKMNTFTI